MKGRVRYRAAAAAVVLAAMVQGSATATAEEVRHYRFKGTAAHAEFGGYTPCRNISVLVLARQELTRVGGQRAMQNAVQVTYSDTDYCQGQVSYGSAVLPDRFTPPRRTLDSASANVNIDVCTRTWAGDDLGCRPLAGEVLWTGTGVQWHGRERYTYINPAYLHPDGNRGSVTKSRWVGAGREADVEWRLTLDGQPVSLDPALYDTVLTDQRLNRVRSGDVTVVGIKSNEQPEEKM